MLRRTDGRRKGPKRTAALQVVGSARLGKGASVTVVRVGDAQYVLGVTEQSVTLLKTEEAAPDVVDAEVLALPAAPVPAGAPDLRRAVTDQLLGRRPAAREGVATPPTTAAFLRDAYRVARGRSAESTDLSEAAVATALAGVRGDQITQNSPAKTLQRRRPGRRSTGHTTQPAGCPRRGRIRSAHELTSRPAAPPWPARHALRDEEHPWTRACRPAPRTAVEPVRALPSASGRLLGRPCPSWCCCPWSLLSAPVRAGRAVDRPPPLPPSSPIAPVVPVPSVGPDGATPAPPSSRAPRSTAPARSCRRSTPTSATARAG